MSEEQVKQISQSEAVKLGATDGIFYSRHFFPKTCRQPSPPYHRETWNVLDAPSRYKSVKIFRDGAKTTMTRLYSSRRIAYGRSRTILWVGKSEGHACRSVEWLARQVLFNPYWANTFGLRKGSPWNDKEIEILGQDGYACRVLAYGVTGSVRGINVDDYRPDTIVLDDLCDKENTATPEQRQNMEDLVFADLYHSLAATTDSPFAAFINLGTSIDPADINEKMQKDPNFHCAEFPIFNGSGESQWVDKWTTEALLKEKANAILNNRLSLWMSEKELSFISKETSIFVGSNLLYYDAVSCPEKFDGIVMSIDPVPPASDAQIAKGLRDKDYEVLCVCGIYKGRYYVLEYCMNKGHNPDWTIAKFFELLERWHPRKCQVESVNYQRTLKWLIEQAMRQRRQYCQIMDKTDQRSKQDRIDDSLHGPTSNKLLHVRREMTEFIEQFSRYPKVSHDDVLEAVAVCVKALQSPEFQGSFAPGEAESLPPLIGYHRAP